jgi:hypothetical protein
MRVVDECFEADVGNRANTMMGTVRPSVAAARSQAAVHLTSMTTASNIRSLVYISHVDISVHIF